MSNERYTMTPVPGTRTDEPLVGWGDFDDLDRTIKMRLYGKLVTLAAPIQREYHSDLFLDALTLDAQLRGEATIWFVVRHSGTHLRVVNDGTEDPTALSYVTSVTRVSSDSVTYRLVLTVDARQMWHLSTEQCVVTEN